MTRPTALPPSLVLTLVLAALSGAAGLAHQILWTRRLVDVLGANSDTFSKVVGTFFAGLALGAWISIWRRWSAGGRDWIRVALAELAVAALAAPLLGAGSLAELRLIAGLGPALKWLLPILLVGPPAVAMGLVLPWMVRAAAAHPGYQPGHATLIYAINTLGGIAGIGFSLALALPRWGLNGASLAAIALNLVVAAGAWHRQRHTAAARNPTDADDAHLTDELTTKRATLTAIVPGRAFALLAFASGFLVLALEVVVQIQLAQVTINSFYSSALVLTLVLTSLAAAAILSPWLTRSLGSILPVSLGIAAALCALQPFVLLGLRGGLEILPYELTALPYTGRVLLLGLVAVSPMFLAAGLLFPQLLQQAASSGGRASRHAAIGRLLLWNGLGGWCGAEIAQAWLVPLCGLWTSVGAIGAVYLLAMLSTLVPPAAAPASTDRSRDLHLPGPRSPKALGMVMAMAIAAVAMLAVAYNLISSGRLPQTRVNPDERLLALDTGREGVVATVDCGPEDRRLLFNNSYTLGGSKARFNQERQGLLPLLLHGRPTSVATLGIATGGSLAGVTLHPDVQHIDAIELSPLVLQHAATHFAASNRDALRDPRVQVQQEDARWVIARQAGRHDVVVGDLFLPWRTGEGRLFALEHFRNVRRSLKPDGLYCQWLPLFQLTRPQFEVIARTFSQIFSNAYVVRGDFYSELPIVGLVGGRTLDQIPWGAVGETCARLRTTGQCLDPLVRQPEGVAMLVTGPLPMPAPGPLNTLGNAWLEWDAGHNILGLRTPWFVGIPCGEFLRDVQRAGLPFLPESLRAAHDAGQFFLTLEIAAKLKHPQLPDLLSQARARLPESLRTDPGADWRQWPMRVKPQMQ